MLGQEAKVGSMQRGPLRSLRREFKAVIVGPKDTGERVQGTRGEKWPSKGLFICDGVACS